jgi:hypothetical protein
MYWKSVTPCSRQSLKKWLAENFRRSTRVAPDASAMPTAHRPPAEW